MSRPQFVVHGHFYQPPRVDPFSGLVPSDPAAAPARDWNARISADCYRPNAELGNLGAMSWNLGPTLAGWLTDGDPIAMRGFVDGDDGGNGMAQPFHHPILPLASNADRRTEVRWGLRDFEVRFGRRPTGMWLPETAVDRASLRMLVDEGVTHTILAPWQVAADRLDTRRPVRLDLGDGRSIIAVLYDGPLSTAVSFDPSATIDADRFVQERVMPRFGDDDGDAVADPLIVIATDGELYGHHQPLREHFLARLVGRSTPADRPYERPSLGDAVRRAAATGIPMAHLRERTSWSCHHGIVRWSAGCGCVLDGGWKGPLRIALERLAGGIDGLTDEFAGRRLGVADPWLARDAYVDVVIGVTDPDTFATTWLGAGAPATDRALFLAIMDAQRWRLSMFASCAWFWESPARPETTSALRAATRAARLMDLLAGTDLEGRLLADLATLDGTGPTRGGQPEPDRNPTARGLRATG